MKEYPEKYMFNLSKEETIRRMMNELSHKSMYNKPKKNHMMTEGASRQARARKIYEQGKARSAIRSGLGGSGTAGERNLGNKITKARRPLSKLISRRGKAGIILAGLGAAAGYFAQKRAARGEK